MRLLIIGPPAKDGFELNASAFRFTTLNANAIDEQQLREMSDSYEVVSHEYRLLQTAREMEREGIEKTKEEYDRLKDDYTKLQTEFNEWIELIEQAGNE